MEVELYKEYKERVVPALQEKHGYKNIHQVPKLEKVVINACVGSAPDVKQALEEAKKEIATITGQKPMETRAKKSIANFKLRENQAIGAKVTLRGATMYEFLERLIKTALPRIRDFRGVSARGVRRPGQLHARRDRPVDLPGDRAGQNPAQHRLRREHRHQRQDERGSQVAADANSGMPFSDRKKAA